MIRDRVLITCYILEQVGKYLKLLPCKYLDTVTCVSTADWYYKMYYYSMLGVRVVGSDYKALPKMQVLLPNEW